MKYKVTLMQEHVVYLEADDELEAVRQIRSMNDVDISEAEKALEEMEKQVCFIFQEKQQL